MSQPTPDHQQEASHFTKLIIGAIGVVYGDIGTSPLYAFKESFLGAHFAADPAHVLNILSLIFWSVMITVTLKYVIIMMRADNKGEGGSLALLALASRYSHDRKWLAFVVPLLGIFAAALFYGDSIITPAISVLSAVEGLNVVSSQLGGYIIPLTLIILMFLFASQRLGTSEVGRLFGPIMCVWFVTIAAMGLVHIFNHPEVLTALNPIYAVNFFINDGTYAFLTMGSVVLAMTGAEALYADMGHFGKAPIRMAWTSLIFPSLMLNYFGQGAFVISNPEGVSNPFFMMAPSWFQWPLVGLATMATIIASQAVISGAFSVTQQAIQLGYLPRMSIVHTSENQIGQIYVPFINWSLLIFVCMLVIGFKTSSGLAHAYGVAVTGTMLIDTLLLGVVIFRFWKWKPVFAVPVMAVLLTVDLSYFLATSTKILHGGWFPLFLGLVVFIMLTTWKRGRAILHDKLRSESMPVDRFLAEVSDNFPHVEGTAVFMYNLDDGVPTSLLLNLRHNKILHDLNIFLHVSVLEKPYVAEEKRLEITPLGKSFYRVTVLYGFKDKIDVPADLMKRTIDGELLVHEDTTYFIGKETIIPTALPGMAIWREHLFAWISKNASSAADFYNLPSKRIMELGSRIDI